MSLVYTAANTPTGVDEKLAMLLSYAARGWQIFPIYEAPGGKCACNKPKCSEIGKHPRYEKKTLERGLKDASNDPAQIQQWHRKWPHANWALATGAASGVVAVDIDDVERATIALEQNPLSPTLISQTAKGFHFVYRHPGNCRIPNKSYSKTLGIDIRGDDGYIVISPSVHASGSQYAWLDLDTEIAPLPDGLLEALETKHREAKRVELSGETAEPPVTANRLASLAANVRAATRKTVSLPHSAEMEAEIRSALRFVSAEAYDDWYKVLLILFRLGWGDVGKAIAHEWSKSAPNFDEIAFEKKWTDASKASMRDDPVTYRGLFMHARQEGWQPQHQEAYEAFATSGDVIDQLNVQYILISKPAGIYRAKYSDYVSNEQFLTQTADIPAQTKDGKPIHAGRMWLSHPRRRKAEGVVFEPGKPSITDNNEINLWIDPKHEACEGDVGPFNELMQHLFKGDEILINQVTQFFAAPFLEPGLKIHYGLLLHSVTQGTGKSLLAETIGRLYGKHYTTITNDELKDNFNDWIKAKQFVIGEEIALGDKRSVMSAVQNYITRSTVQVNVKGQPRLEMRNCANFIFLSNKPDALHLEDTDRRFFVIHVTEETKAEEFYKHYVEWRENGGDKHLLHFLLSYDLIGFNAKGHAPMTDDKRELIGLGRSEVEQYIRDVMDDESDKAREFNRRFHALIEEGLDENAAAARACAETKKLTPLRTAAELLIEFHNTPHGRDTTKTALGRALGGANVPKQQIQVNTQRNMYYAMHDLELWRGKADEEWRRQIIRQNENGPHLASRSPLFRVPKR